MNMISKSIEKIDGLNITTGKPLYTDDLSNTPLIIKILRSPHAFAKILKIHTSRAEALDGVECVLTYKDVPNTRFTIAGQSYPEPSAYDRLILDNIVRYVGDEVAIIAAIDEKTALKAMNLISVEYEVYKPVLDYETAHTHESVIHSEDNIEFNIDQGQDVQKNIAACFNTSFGDIDKGFLESDVICEKTYSTQGQCHAMMETYRAYSYMDHNNRLTVVSSTQIPFHVRRILSRALEIPSSLIRIIKPRIGGGFGGKQSALMEMYTGLVTLKTGKPSKLIYTRKETFKCSTMRHPMKMTVKIGASKDGIIKAIDINALSDTGAYGEHAFTVFSVAGKKVLPLYGKVQNARFGGKVLYTNKVPSGAFRGYGVTQGLFSLESALNELATKLNMDPITLREKNLIEVGDSHPLLGGSTKDNYVTLESSTLKDCIKRGKELINWDELYPSKKISETKVRGVGMALAIQGSGIAKIDTASAHIKLNDTGSYTLLLGSADMGTGCDTILNQMAAEILCTNTSNISVHSADTDVSPFDTGSYASSTTYVTGNAVINGANDLKDKILHAGAKLLNESKDNVYFDGQFVKSVNKKISLKEICNKLSTGPGGTTLMGIGSFGSDTSPPPFVAGFCEVEVDIQTGKVDLINYVAVVDCGTVINPNLAKIQVEGGLVQGIGLALYEDVVHDKNGHMINSSFMQYKIPSRKDIKNIVVEFKPSFEPTGPFGAKSIGEVVTNTPAPAIVNAIYNAVGVHIRNLPVTPEKVMMELLNK